MTCLLPSRRRATLQALAALASMLVGAGGHPAHAQSRLDAQYTVSMTGIPIGRLAWQTEITEDAYTTSASGSGSGLVGVLLSGEGTVVTRGTISRGQLVPASVTSDVKDEDGNTDLRMTFEDGVAKLLTAEPPPKPDRVPVTEAHRIGVTDPLSAMLIPVVVDGDFLMPENCHRTLAIFDGQRRYNVALSFKRTGTIKVANGYSGPALVCGAILQPVAGHRAGSMLVKYVAGRRDVELWFAPITGARFIAPIRVSMPTLIGTLEINADWFGATPTPARGPIEPNAARR
jgi:hypothetical protein